MKLKTDKHFIYIIVMNNAALTWMLIQYWSTNISTALSTITVMIFAFYKNQQVILYEGYFWPTTEKAIININTESRM